MRVNSCACTRTERPVTYIREIFRDGWFGWYNPKRTCRWMLYRGLRIDFAPVAERIVQLSRSSCTDRGLRDAFASIRYTRQDWLISLLRVSCMHSRSLYSFVIRLFDRGRLRCETYPVCGRPSRVSRIRKF